MNKFEKNDLIEYNKQLGTIHCKIDSTDDCYLLEFEGPITLYCLIAQEQDITLIAKNAFNKIFKEGDKVITLKGKGIIKTVDDLGEQVAYEVTMEDESARFFFRGQVWDLKENE